MADVAGRAQAKRWDIRARAARARVMNAISGLAAVRGLVWCGFEESGTLTQQCSALGKDSNRVIQRWDDLDELSVLMGQVRQPEGVPECFLLVLDSPDAGWAKAPTGEALAVLMPALHQMTDGFLLMNEEKKSLLSVDVESHSAACWVETTVIGAQYEWIRRLLASGPDPLPIYPTTR